MQIWFQNRRQASRRKSKPLELHEIAHYQSLHSAQQGSPFSDSPYAVNATPIRNGDSSHHSLPSLPSSAEHRASRTLPPPFATTPTTVSTVTPRLDNLSSSNERVRPSSAYLADLRNETPRSSQEEYDVSPSTTISQESPTTAKAPPKVLQRTSSNVRLSMSFDGNAKIITKEDTSPSPPRRKPVAGPLSENIDPAASSEVKDNGDAPMRPPTLTRKPSGRSRDSRAWEYWADKDARSELEEKANRETSGSAADAIGLIRSSSGRNILGALTNKRGLASNEDSTAKRSKRTALLQRSQSMQNRQSFGRSAGSDKGEKSPRKFRKAQSGLGIQIYNPDSDKENWSPERIVSRFDGADSPTDSESGEHQRQRTTVTPGKTLLAVTDHRTSFSSSPDLEDENDGLHGRRRAREDDRQRKSNSVSEEEELDCVQGLLSLSQGNWR